MRSARSTTSWRGSGRRPVSASAAAIAAILAGVLWSIGAVELSQPEAFRFAMLLVGLVLLGLAVRGVPVGGAACVYAVVIAWIERSSRELLERGSDVLPATTEALEVVLSGGNPYTHVMQSTVPVGSPFVYPPGEMLFYLGPYLLGIPLGQVEIWSGILTVVLMALAGLRVGWGHAALPAMLYAVWGIAAFRTTDGGNDVSAGLLAVAGLVLLAFPGRAAFLGSAILLGWALAFKQFAVVLVPLVLRHVAATGAEWRAYAAVTLGTTAAMCLPLFVRDPAAFVTQMFRALTFQQEVWGANLPHILQEYGVEVEPYLRVFFVLEIALLVAGLLLALRDRMPTIGRAAIWAGLLVCVPLLLARWTTQSYYVYAATLVLAGLALIAARARPERIP